MSLYDASPPRVHEKQFSSYTRNHSEVKSKIRNEASNTLFTKFRLPSRVGKHQSYNMDEDKVSEMVYGTYNNKFESSTAIPSVCIWISAKDKKGSYIDVVKLRGFLELNIHKVCFSFFYH